MFVKIRLSSLKFGFLKYEMLTLFCCFCNPLNQNKQTDKQTNKKKNKYYLLLILESRYPYKAYRSLLLLGKCCKVFLLQNIPNIPKKYFLTRHRFVTTVVASALWKILSET